MDIYGIKNCDTCRKALRFLDENGIEHDWHDVREEGLEVAVIQQWLQAVGADVLVNRRSTTWRQLSEVERVEAMSAVNSAAVLSDSPTLIKRPVFVTDDDVLIGFGPAVQDRLLELRS